MLRRKLVPLNLSYTRHYRGMLTEIDMRPHRHPDCFLAFQSRRRLSMYVYRRAITADRPRPSTLVLPWILLQQQAS